MEDNFTASRHCIGVADLLLQVSAMVQNAGCRKRIDAEEWLMNWLDMPNSAFNGVCPRVLLQDSKADQGRFEIGRSDDASAISATAKPVSTGTLRQSDADLGIPGEWNSATR